MIMNENEIVSAALALPAASRAMIIKIPTDSLTESSRPETELSEIETAWLNEIEDRVTAFERGELAAMPGYQILRDLRGRAVK